MNTEEFVEKARKIHGEDTYDYTRVVYSDSKTKVEIVCPRHGSFFQAPGRHVCLTSTRGCPKCGTEKNTLARSFTAEKFVESSRKVHGDIYDYSKVIYSNMHTNVELVCLIHGTFIQTPRNHIAGQGCPKCGDMRVSAKLAFSPEHFIEAAKQVHRDKYNYEKIIESYKNSTEKVEIICPEHGSFWQTPQSHKNGVGCPKCGLEKCKAFSLTRVLPPGEFIEKAKEIHGEKYDYSRSKYINNRTLIEIFCPKHGSFWQRSTAHFRGRGCPKCGLESSTEARRSTTDQFIEKAKKIHGDKFTYKKVNYISSILPVEITCKKHGSFWQVANNHSQGAGCPKCSSNTSAGEKEVLTYLLSLGVQAKKERINKFEIDIYVPDKNIGIEYNGLYWHREDLLGRDYHIDKTNLFANNGIRLIQIFEDEWQTKKELVKAKLAYILGVSNLSKIGARKTTITSLTSEETKDFLERNHIQGYIHSAVRLGLKYQEALVAVATFSHSRFDTEDSWEVIRYATSQPVQGGFSKLLKHFLSFNPEVTRLVSYSDLRWSTGDVYKRSGFELESVSSPGYYWCKGNARFNRQRFMKHKLSKVLETFDPDKTEEENCVENGYWKVYDCGQQKWVLSNPSPCIPPP